VVIRFSILLILVFNFATISTAQEIDEIDFRKNSFDIGTALWGISKAGPRYLSGAYERRIGGAWSLHIGGHYHREYIQLGSNNSEFYDIIGYFGFKYRFKTNSKLKPYMGLDLTYWLTQTELSSWGTRWKNISDVYGICPHFGIEPSLTKNIHFYFAVSAGPAIQRYRSVILNTSTNKWDTYRDDNSLTGTTSQPLSIGLRMKF
jgi:hypothetical protein